MLLFRSEEHIDRWCEQWRRPRGGVMTLEQQWGMAIGWYAENRGDPSWRRKTVEEAEALFAELGLTGEFWRLR
ncbi:MAG TPA: hypothetical protein VJ276_25365 [Thermoanaerobaculia bacterium]|nr:hypothetical protein [Thermoanaerobaculia bacterium]